MRHLARHNIRKGLAWLVVILLIIVLTPRSCLPYDISGRRLRQVDTFVRGLFEWLLANALNWVIRCMVVHNLFYLFCFSGFLSNKLVKVTEGFDHCHYPGFAWLWCAYWLSLLTGSTSFEFDRRWRLDTITVTIELRSVDITLRLNRVDSDLLEPHISNSCWRLQGRVFAPIHVLS